MSNHFYAAMQSLQHSVHFPLYLGTFFHRFVASAFSESVIQVYFSLTLDPGDFEK